MTANDIYILVPYSFDGVGAFMAAKWFLEQKKYNVNLVPTSKERFCSDYQTLVPLNPYRIYIVGGYIVDNCDEELDGEKVVVFKLGKENIKLEGVKIVSGDFDNFTSLLLNVFKNLYKTELDTKKMLLLNLLQDYITYKLKYGQVSIGLNYVFQNLNNFGENKLEKFCKKYPEGFESFSDDDKRVIRYNQERLKKFLEGDRFVGTLPGPGGDYKIVSCFATSCINEVAATILKENSGDVAIIVNPNTEIVTFRRSGNCTLNLKKLSQKLCDGDGKEFAASGKITENFLTFTQTLQKI
jgi:oligoribonuclease NrnB/cAMP/cGMP phosphodiesterase (DHH superfamily)